MKLSHRLMDIFFSRKFLAVAIASAMCWFAKIGEYTWGIVIVAYIGANLADSKIKKKNMEGMYKEFPEPDLSGLAISKSGEIVDKETTDDKSNL